MIEDRGLNPQVNSPDKIVQCRTMIVIIGFRKSVRFVKFRRRGYWGVGEGLRTESIWESSVKCGSAGGVG